jgi:hypothetical protein
LAAPGGEGQGAIGVVFVLRGCCVFASGFSFGLASRCAARRWSRPAWGGGRVGGRHAGAVGVVACGAVRPSAFRPGRPGRGQRYGVVSLWPWGGVAQLRHREEAGGRLSVGRGGPGGCRARFCCRWDGDVGASARGGLRGRWTVRSDAVTGLGVGWVAVAIAVAGSFPRVRSGGLSAGMMPVSGVWRAFSFVCAAVCSAGGLGDRSAFGVWLAGADWVPPGAWSEQGCKGAEAQGSNLAQQHAHEDHLGSPSSRKTPFSVY